MCRVYKGSGVFHVQSSAYIQPHHNYIMTKYADQQLSQTLEIIGGLANKASILALSGKNNSDLQKAIVGIIRGGEFAFEELTGVKYHQEEDTIPN